MFILLKTNINMKMNYQNFVDTWLNNEPRKNQEEFENDIIELLKYYGVQFDEQGFIIKPDRSNESKII